MDQAVSTPAASPLSIMARLKQFAELTRLVAEKLAVQPSTTMAALKIAMASAKIVTVLRLLGFDLDAPVRVEKAFELEGGPEVIDAPRTLTAKFYDFDPNRKHGQRKKDNQQAMALLDQIDKGELSADALTDGQRETLARYSGTGGNLVGADGKKGSAYEYYTPKPIAAGMWELLAELGFKGGKVLDPCAGVGIFGATAPANAAMETVELNETSGRVNQLVNSGPGYNAIISPFEAVASRTADEIYDAVVSNIPFGGVHDRGSNRKIDPKYQDQPLETYFILRSLEKLKPGGLAAFIVPPRVVSAKGGREEQLRIAASYMAEFRGAYRLPNSVFGGADADTITDVIVFRKFSRDARQKIEEIKEQNPGLLVQTNVQWTEFIGGMYFQGEGKRFVLGEFQAKDPNKFRDVDRVLSDNSIPNIAKLLRKFPDSRIDWKLLDATETDAIVYNEGDTITMAGQTLEMREGVWVALGRSADDDRYDSMGESMSGAAVAVTNKVSWAQANDYVMYLRSRSMELDLPLWLRAAHRDVQMLDNGDQAKYWGALSAGLASVEVSRAHGEVVGFNYLEEYPAISEALQAAASVARSSPAKFSRDGKSALQKVGIVYDRKTGFSAIWKGEAQASVSDGQVLSEDDQVMAVKYNSQGVTIDVDQLKKIYGDSFDPLTSDDWCVSADGKQATKADDYYTGNYAEFLARMDADIAAASGDVLEKLLRQKTGAEARLSKTDPHDLRFNLFSPFVEIEEKAEFLRRFMHPAFTVAFDKDGNKVIICDIGTPKTEQERQYKRFAEYLKKGNLSTRSQEGESAELDTQRRKMLRDYASQSNAQFDQWVKSNPVIMSRLATISNDPERIYFNEVDDVTPVQIPGMADGLKLHGYQNAYVRKMGRSFGGINGYDVGLGKTFTALAAVQYVQSIGVKKKTLFVVPNSVLSNWRKEVGRAYTDLSGCLFVGLDVNEKTGKSKVDSKNYARDFNRILENRHGKIFCTLEAFKTIPLKDETIGDYDTYLMSVDPSYEGSEKNADSEVADSKRAEATSGTGGKSSAVPYFEDMGIDSLVMDEAHMFKNSKNTVEFSGAKFLSVSEASQRGLDIQMKAWYVRGLSPLKDGVLSLTATPITNSPLEIYSMLCLAVGEKKVHDLCMGARGADAFMDTMCLIEDDEEVSVDGQIKPYRVFRGLQNVNLLRDALNTVATIKTGADVKDAGDDLKLPESPETKSAVALTEAARAALNEYKMAYRAARYETGVVKKDTPPPTPEEMAALERVSTKYGESLELIAHPFNLINKMTLLIADPELDERASFYQFADSQKDKAVLVIAAFNKLGRIEARGLAGPWTEADSIVGSKIVRDGENETVLVKIKVQAKLDSGRIVVDTLDTNFQSDFEAQAEKAGLELDVSVPPKLAALLDNVQNEEVNPRSSSGRVKQLIFCDVLPLHNKIKRLLTKRSGISSAAIAVISGQSIKNAEQMQGIQDDFNAEGEDNKFRVIIANEKAEVGINLQKGTQAIHHLTIGWTPDSIHQRNGRGVRQGNTTARVNIYHYDADGTFDEYKRTLTGKKADWIGAVMDKQGGNDVAVSGGLTNDQYDELIESMGDADKVNAIRERASLRERLQREDTARGRQVINLKTAESQQVFSAKYKTADKWVVEKMMALYDLRVALQPMIMRAGSDKTSASSMIKLEGRIADTRARIEGLTREIGEAAKFEATIYNPTLRKSENLPRSIEDLMTAHTYGRSETAAKSREAVLTQLQRAEIVVNEDTALIQDWASEIDAARSMVEQAVKDFERIAKDSPGAYPTEMVTAFKEGAVTVMDGRLFARGMFVRDTKGTLVVMKDKTFAVRFPTARRTVADMTAAKWTFIMFGTPDYEDALNEAAALDDAAKDVNSSNRDYLFGSVLPAVALRRKTATMITYSPSYIKLPAPYFPYLVNPANANTPILNAIVESQMAMGLKWRDDDRVELASTVEIEEISSYGTTSPKLRSLTDFAVSKSMKLTVADIGVVVFNGTPMQSTIAGTIVGAGKWPADPSAVFASAATQEALQTAVQDMMAQAMPWLAIDGSMQPGTWLPVGAVIAYNRRRTVIDAEARQAAGPGTVEVAPVVVSAGGIQPNARGMIGIQGETRPNKETIKAAAKAVGGYAKWNGDAGQWEVPAKTWEYLVSNHAQVARVLYPVPA